MSKGRSTKRVPGHRVMSAARGVAILAVLALGGPAVAADPDGIAFFEKRVRPLLVKHCYSCHSAEAKKLKGELLLDTRAGVLKGGTSGPAVVAGDPGKSLLVKLVRHADES